MLGVMLSQIGPYRLPGHDRLVVLRARQRMASHRAARVMDDRWRSPTTFTGTTVIDAHGTASTTWSPPSPAAPCVSPTARSERPAGSSARAASASQRPQTELSDP